jgi:hypothetical protein
MKLDRKELVIDDPIVPQVPKRGDLRGKMEYTYIMEYKFIDTKKFPNLQSTYYMYEVKLSNGRK